MIYNRRAFYPSPLIDGRLKFPSIRIYSEIICTAKEPKIALFVGPFAGFVEGGRCVGGGKNALSAENAGLVEEVGAVHPGPLALLGNNRFKD